MHDRGRILNLYSAEIKRGSMRGNLRGAMEKVEGDERLRGKKGGGEKEYGRKQEKQSRQRAGDRKERAHTK